MNVLVCIVFFLAFLFFTFLFLYVPKLIHEIFSFMMKTFHVAFSTTKSLNLSFHMTETFNIIFCSENSKLTFSWCLLGDVNSFTNVCRAHFVSAERILYNTTMD